MQKPLCLQWALFSTVLPAPSYIATHRTQAAGVYHTFIPLTQTVVIWVQL